MALKVIFPDSDSRIDLPRGSSSPSSIYPRFNASKLETIVSSLTS